MEYESFPIHTSGGARKIKVPVLLNGVYQMMTTVPITGISVANPGCAVVPSKTKKLLTIAPNAINILISTKNGLCCFFFEPVFFKVNMIPTKAPDRNSQNRENGK